ncbi:unnamed protein product [Candidatus Protochlamydia amoebophila UWE25]|uniref:Glycosyltransferase family 92 protein n=2 Tax=Candidatus Protochlamydia amoebophila TaxID=362787 RepID=A0A2P9HAL1_PARUW|nr:unnamed protein product [Candidatus Protochlamydia amoebophila UWE25]
MKVFEINLLKQIKEFLYVNQFSKTLMAYMNYFLSIIFLFFINTCEGYIYDLSVCAIFKNEAPYLREWIEYHRLIGVKHFYLYNHDSTDHYDCILEPYIQLGIVELENAINYPDFNGTQVDCYNRCLIKSRGVSTWVAFIDIDEFILPALNVDLAWLLSHYINYAGVALNWRCFGTSQIANLKEDELMISQLVMCSLPDYSANVHVKSIVRPELVVQFCCPHNPVYVPGYYAVDVDKFPQEGPLSQTVKLNQIRINHYWTRDEHFFTQYKKPRRLAWGDSEAQIYLFLKDLNVDRDETILRYISRLKIAIEK